MDSKKLSITVKNFGKKNELMQLVFTGLILILALLGIIYNWRNAIALILIFLLIILSKKFQLRLSILIFIYILSMVLISFIPKIELVEVFATSLFLSPLFFYNSIYQNFKDLKKDDTFEVFSLNFKTLKCLHTEDNDYKSYALNPKQFLKTLSVSDINSFVFRNNNLLILTKNGIIRPKELSPQNLNEINTFIKENFPYKLNIETEYQNALKAENSVYLSKFLLTIPIIAVCLVIYFFGDNGRNQMVSYGSILVLILFYIFLIVRIKTKKINESE